MKDTDILTINYGEHYEQSFNVTVKYAKDILGIIRAVSSYGSSGFFMKKPPFGEEKFVIFSEDYSNKLRKIEYLMEDRILIDKHILIQKISDLKNTEHKKGFIYKLKLAWKIIAKKPLYFDDFAMNEKFADFIIGNIQKSTYNT